MLGDCPMVAFLATTKPEAAKTFFGTALGLTLIEDGPFSMVFESGGTRMRLQKVEALTPPVGTALGWTVPDIVGTMTALAARGVTFERFAGMDQDQAGVWVPPGTTAKVCWFKDPDGNLLSLTQSA
jgi:catechol 2,3-dioxygenase-like lactoylglutathione lyase family enzyme